MFRPHVGRGLPKFKGVYRVACELRQIRNHAGHRCRARIAGYPHLTVPMGAVAQLAGGISFMGARRSDHAVLKAGAAYERVRTARLPSPSFRP
jgi:amidase